ncbi:MAG: Gfo/Idh/MocA family oxidoreductase [Candidatus Helarchaeota archaeon]|nr:Gfo/Idh/MocA family oxidoreductase [Candidatus Helarchaeota archaeon]
MSFVKFGVIGCGQAATMHAIGIKRNSKLKFVAAYDIDPKILKRFAKRQKIEPYADLYQLLESDIDAVHIILPHYLHAKIVVEAAKAGKHVLCEKPMATSLEECDEMIAATKKAGVKFMIAENHRFLPAHQYIKDAVSQGLIGEVFLGRAYEGAYDRPEKILDPNHWMFSYDRGGGGALFDQGVHKFATLNWILGEVESAQCWVYKALPSPPNKGDDTALVHLRYKNGAMVEVTVTTAAIHTPTNRLELHGTKGTILEDHAWEKPVQIFSTLKEEWEGQFYSPELEHGPFPRYYTISFRIEDVYFAECILNDKTPEFTPEQAKEAVAVAHLAYLAAKNKGTTSMDELKKIIKAEGTKALFDGIEKVIQNNYDQLSW